MLSVQREFEFTQYHFDTISDFVNAQTGIVLTPAKVEMVYGRLSKHVRQHHAGQFDDFCAAIVAGDQLEQEFLINAITTNLTAFFREPHHFHFLREQLIPKLLQQATETRKIRIWSAGCSTGEEAYSLAMTLLDEIPDIHLWDVKILATDIDANVLTQAKSGIYPAERVELLDDSLKKKYFLYRQQGQSTEVKLKSSVRALVSFKRLNLLEDWPMKGHFDFIFCRNVIIYFDKMTQTQLFDRYADFLKEEGHIFIGHSESLYNISERYELLGHTIYKKLS